MLLPKDPSEGSAVIGQYPWGHKCYPVIVQKHAIMGEWKQSYGDGLGTHVDVVMPSGIRMYPEPVPDKVIFTHSQNTKGKHKGHCLG